MRYLIAIALFSMAAVPALAADQAMDAIKTPPAATPDKKICRRLDASTGSVMSKRVCKTQAEWKAEAAAEAAAPHFSVPPSGMTQDPVIGR